MKTAIAYIRASKVEQALSPDAQRHAIEAFAKREGIEIVGVYVDHLSGGTPLEKRPGLLLALDELKRQSADCLIVAKRDRLARDTLTAAMIERIVGRQGGQVLSAQGEGNGTSPEAAMLRGIMDVFAQYERALIRFRTSSALQVKKRRGERVGRIPFGWQLAADGKQLEICEHEQKLLARMQQLREDGYSLRGVAKVFEDADIRNREGHLFSHVSIAGLLERNKQVAA